MNWLIQVLGSSIGKKMLMAITGLSFCGFLVAHLIGNLFIYGGQDAFNSYAEHLHALGPVLNVAEIALLLLFIVHIVTGVFLFLRNLKCRPVRYKINKSAGGRTVGSATMPYTGILLLMFVIFHLMNFHFVDKSDRTIFQIVSDAFTNPLYISLYIAAMIVVAIHVSHGFWSAFQTLGGDHPKYTPLFRTLSIMFSVAVGFGFGLIPVYIAFIA